MYLLRRCRRDIKEVKKELEIWKVVGGWRYWLNHGISFNQATAGTVAEVWCTERTGIREALFWSQSHHDYVHAFMNQLQWCWTGLLAGRLRWTWTAQWCWTGLLTGRLRGDKETFRCVVIICMLTNRLEWCWVGLLAGRLRWRWRNVQVCRHHLYALTNRDRNGVGPSCW